MPEQNAMPAQSNKYVFKLSYDSTSTQDNTIDAITLGHSLISMSELIKESAKVLEGDEADPRVEVSAHEPGSFIVEFVAWLSAGGIDTLRALGIASPVVGTVTGSAFAAIKAMRNRKQETKRVTETMTQITFKDGESIELSNNVDKLLSNLSIRTKIEQVIKRSSDVEKGATVKVLSEDDQVIEQIEPEQTKFFKAPPRKVLAEILERENTVNVTFTVVALESKSGWKIKFANGEEVSVKMNDDSFLERMSNRKDAPIKGDMFEVVLKTIESKVEGSTRTTRSIERVTRHRVDEARKVL